MEAHCHARPGWPWHAAEINGQRAIYPCPQPKDQPLDHQQHRCRHDKPVPDFAWLTRRRAPASRCDGAAGDRKCLRYFKRTLSRIEQVDGHSNPPDAPDADPIKHTKPGRNSEIRIGAQHRSFEAIRVDEHRVRINGLGRCCRFCGRCRPPRREQPPSRQRLNRIGKKDREAVVHRPCRLHKIKPGNDMDCAAVLDCCEHDTLSRARKLGKRRCVIRGLRGEHPALPNADRTE